MNTRTVITTLSAALTLAFAGHALAQEATVDTASFGTSKSRAEVQAELAQARAAGQLIGNEADELRAAPQPGTRSRADVTAETRDAAASGELKALNAEASSYLPWSLREPTRMGQVLAKRS
jgi:Domain of unknown function (DUF4148)